MGREQKPQVEGRWRAFALAYIADPNLNATRAAIAAGYAEKGARRQGCVLLKDPRVIEIVNAEMAKRAERTQIDADYVTQSINRIVAKAEMKKDYGAALKGLELLGKHLKLFTDKVEHSGLVVTVRDYTGRRKPAEDAAG